VFGVVWVDGVLWCSVRGVLVFYLVEFNPNFTYMLWSARAEDNVYHKDKKPNLTKVQNPVLMEK
jgi:hypothetical protein